MKRLKNLDMQKIEKLFSDNFVFDKKDLEKGFTYFSITPIRKENKNAKGIKKWKLILLLIQLMNMAFSLA